MTRAQKERQRDRERRGIGREKREYSLCGGRRGRLGEKAGKEGGRWRTEKKRVREEEQRAEEWPI